MTKKQLISTSILRGFNAPVKDSRSKKHKPEPLQSESHSESPEASSEEKEVEYYPVFDFGDPDVVNALFMLD